MYKISDIIIKYVSLIVIVFFLMFPLRLRAKVIWFLFSIKKFIKQGQV